MSASRTSALMGWLIALASAGCARTVAVPAHATSAQHQSRTQPPAPLITTLGTTRTATLVSYCWQESGRGVCADGALGLKTAQALRWSVNAGVRVDLGLAAHDVQFQTARITRNGVEHDVLPIRGRALDSGGRTWTMCLAPRVRHATNLLISARFAQGEIFADIRLTPVRPAAGRRDRRAC